MVAANGDSLAVRYNNWFGFKGAVLTLAGGTPPTGMDANWLLNPAFGNGVDKGNPNVAFLRNPWPTDRSFDPTPQPTSIFLNTAQFKGSVNTGSVINNFDDAFFAKTDYRGAFPQDGERWDEGWGEYDPVNKDYRATPIVKITSPGNVAGQSFLQGTKVTITWDTANAPGNRFAFSFGTSPTGPWQPIAGADNVSDAGATRGKLVDGLTLPVIETSTAYIRMTVVGDASIEDVTDFPFAIT